MTLQIDLYLLVENSMLLYFNQRTCTLIKSLLERRYRRSLTVYLDMLPHFNTETVVLLTLRVVHDYLQWYLLSKHKMRPPHFNKQCLWLLRSKTKNSWFWRRGNFLDLVCSGRNKCIWIFWSINHDFLRLIIWGNLEFLIDPVTVIDRNELCYDLVFKNYGSIIIILKYGKARSKFMR